MSERNHGSEVRLNVEARAATAVQLEAGERLFSRLIQRAGAGLEAGTNARREGSEESKDVRGGGR